LIDPSRPDEPDRRRGAAVEHEGFVEACDGARVFYRTAGEGPAVVLCDGIVCEGFVWKYLRPHLARSFRVVHWNYRGHGRSGRVRDLSRVGIEHHAGDLWRVLDALGIDRAAVIGHSMGTQVALEAYRAAPDRAAGLVLACGSYGKVTRTFHGTDVLSRLLPLALEFCVEHPRWVRGAVAMAPAGVALQIAKLSREIDPIRTRAEDMLPYFEHVARMDPEVFVRMLQAAGTHSAEDLLHRVRAPALVVAGERDTFTPPRLARQMAEQIEAAEFVMVTEGSHSCLIEQPELLNPRIEQFLRARVFA
jgi:pimeloyl-ACP methyl ester carboxylesterase